jgi:hypothetical protein
MSHETSLCETCSQLFTPPTTLARLASFRGLKYYKKRSDFLRSAIDGCRLCRELLCIPYYHPTRKRRQGLLPKGADTDWPLEHWTLCLTKLENQLSNIGRFQLLSRLFNPFLHFRISGDVKKQSIVQVKRHRFLPGKKLYPEMTTPSGKLFYSNFKFE